MSKKDSINYDYYNTNQMYDEKFFSDSFLTSEEVNKEQINKNNIIGYNKEFIIKQKKRFNLIYDKSVQYFKIIVPVLWLITFIVLLLLINWSFWFIIAFIVLALIEIQTVWIIISNIEDVYYKKSQKKHNH